MSPSSSAWPAEKADLEAARPILDSPSPTQRSDRSDEPSSYHRPTRPFRPSSAAFLGARALRGYLIVLAGLAMWWVLGAEGEWTRRVWPEEWTRVGEAEAGSLGSMEHGKPRWDLAGEQKIQGVNLGGWLVIEPWITPSLFDATYNDSVIDEFTYSEALGRDEATRRLTHHFETWITQDDMRAVAAAGLNHVRLSIGYWAFDVSGGEPYVSGVQYPYLLKAIRWAKEAGLKIMVDLHSAPGGQNGFDNSGQKGKPLWHTDERNVNRTLSIIHFLATEFAKPEYRDTVTFLQLLNEPAAFRSPQLLDTYKNFAKDAYEVVRHPHGDQALAKGEEGEEQDTSGLITSIHDGFTQPKVWNGFMPKAEYEGAALDIHPYAIFQDAGIEMGEQARIDDICGYGQLMSTINQNMWTTIGEWSPAPTDCAPHLNGRGNGARYDGTFRHKGVIGSCEGKTGSAATFSDQYKEYLARHWAAQTLVFENSTAGWFHWTWKAENADDWSYQAGLEYGWIPRDPSERAYTFEGLCGAALAST